MLVNQNMGNLSGIFNEANRLLSDSNNINSITKSQKIQPTQQENGEENYQKERITYGMISLELMSDEQYMAFERVTAGMSPNEKISVAQTLTRAGNLSASVERVEQKEKSLQEESNSSKDSEKWFWESHQKVGRTSLKKIKKTSRILMESTQKTTTKL